MMFPQIRCYHPSHSVNDFTFYILCKGNNAGQPSFRPWANSYVVICANQKYYDFYFWLFWGLHKSGKFKLRLRGSVIPFINMEDVRLLLREIAPAVFPDWAKFTEIISTLDKLEKLKSNLARQVIASERLQKLLINNYFDDINKKTSQ